MKETIKNLKKEVVESHKTALTKEIEKLPEIQQEVVKCFFQSIDLKDATQRRYSLEYIYECLLLRIKGPSVYEHIRNKEIMVLPCKDTLNKYIGRLDANYGFQPVVFEGLLKRAGRMHIQEKHGMNYYY